MGYILLIFFFATFLPVIMPVCATSVPYVHIVAHDGIAPGSIWCTTLATYLQSHGYGLEVSQNYPADTDALQLIVVDNPYPHDPIATYPYHKRAAIFWEPPCVKAYQYAPAYMNQFALVFTWDDDLVAQDKKFCKFHYQGPSDRSAEYGKIAWEKRKLMVMLNANKKSSHPHELYSKRLAFIQFCQAHCPDDFDLYGAGWPKSWSVYKGFAQDKGATLCQYKFNIAYENIHHIRGYVSEKILDALWQGCVPVYWGADNITEYVPADCFIDRRNFAHDQELYEFLKNMSQERYNQYIHAIDRFLKSPGIQKFTFQSQIDALGSAIVTYIKSNHRLII